MSGAKSGWTITLPVSTATPYHALHSWALEP